MGSTEASPKSVHQAKTGSKWGQSFFFWLFSLNSLSIAPFLLLQSQIYYNIPVGKPHSTQKAICLRFTQYFGILDIFSKSENHPVNVKMVQISENSLLQRNGARQNANGACEKPRKKNPAKIQRHNRFWRAPKGHLASKFGIFWCYN